MVRKPYNLPQPVICMDEQPGQLVKDVKTPIAETLEHAQRADDEYQRAGVANLFMFCEPLAAWREAYARETKTNADWTLLLVHCHA